jgi:uncharacterized protein YycO
LRNSPFIAEGEFFLIWHGIPFSFLSEVLSGGTLGYRIHGVVYSGTFKVNGPGGSKRGAAVNVREIKNLKFKGRPLIFLFLPLFIYFCYHVTLSAVERNQITSPHIYRNADAVYQYYFSKYDLCSLAKRQITTELKMIVNAVVLEEALGHDVTGMLLLSNEIARKKITSEAIQGELEQFNSFILLNEALESTQLDLQTAGSLVKAEEYSDCCAAFARYIQGQNELAQKYALPYRIPMSTLQVLDIRENRFLKVEAHHSENKKPDVLLSGNGEKRRVRTRLEQFPWESADIVLGHRGTDATQSAIQGYWDHVGIYNSDCVCIIDVRPSDDRNQIGGVRRSDFTFWAEQYSDIAVLRLKKIPIATRRSIEQRAAGKLGEPYNLSTHKMNPSGGWYCSKLVYYVYLQEGIDLDVGGGVSVFPDDIAISQGPDSLQCLEKMTSSP